MATYDQNWPVDTLAISDIPGAIREKGRQLKDDGIVKPAAHKSSHANGGSDPLLAADIGAETPVGAQTKVDNHAGLSTAHGMGAGFFIAKTVNSNQVMSWNEIQSKPLVFTPPTAASSQLGGVKIGSGINVTTDGTISVSMPTSSGFQLFTSNSTFTVPVGVTTVFVSLSGGGGGGSGGGRYNGGGGGGCAQAINNYPVNVSPGETITVTVGAGGAGGGGGNAYGSAGGAGGLSSFGSYMTVVGGGGAYPTTYSGSNYGHGGTSYYPDGNGGNGGYTYNDNDGYNYVVYPTSGGGDVCGSAGSSPSGRWGGGGGAGKSISCYIKAGSGGAGSSGTGANGIAGGVYGSGGGGGGAGNSSIGGSGGAGAQGYVLIQW